jgi:Ala-tRNA(Pro) deacylase
MEPIVPLPVILTTLFAELGLSPLVVEHPPLRTVADAHAYWDHLPGLPLKNLFLKDAGGQHWLVVVPAAISVDTKVLATLIGARRLSFGSADSLVRILAVEPGAVTPLAMLHDSKHQVRLVLHAAMEQAPAVLVHPLVNTATLILPPADLRRCLSHCGVTPAIIDLSPAFQTG